MSFIVLFRYKEYVQEYRDKYDSYLSLDKTLESDRYYNDFPRWVVLNFILFYFIWFYTCNLISIICRNKFHKLGKDLDFAKGKDMERYCKLWGQLKDSYRRCGMVWLSLVFRLHMYHLLMVCCDF